MTTTKATMTAITKHETHSYYVIILTFSPVILHCNSKVYLLYFYHVPDTVLSALYILTH